MSPQSGIRTGTLALLAFGALGLATALPAQTTSTGRVSTPGRVFDAERKPIAGAKVTLLVHGEQEELDGGDLVHVESDAEGRFRAALQPARRYAAWAAVARDAVTFVSDKVDVTGGAIELTIADTSAVTQLRFGGLDEWRTLGKLHAHIVPFDCAALAFEGDLDAGTIPVPHTLPDGSLQAEITCDGRLVDVMELSPRGESKVPPPKRLAVRVADEQGAPIAKATVLRVMPRWSAQLGPFLTRPVAARWPVATTDDAGKAEVLIATTLEPLGSKDWAMLVFVATHDGYVEGMAGRVKQPFSDAGPIKDVKALQGVLPFVLRKKEPTVITVKAADGTMPTDVRWVGWRSVPYEGESSTSIIDGAKVPVVDGTMRLAMPPEQAGTATLAVPGRMPVFEANDAWQRLARPMTLIVPTPAVLEGGVLDLRSMQTLRVQVVEASGAPAIGAELLCLPKGGSDYVDPSHGMRTLTDRAGRAVFPMLPGGCFVIALYGSTFAHLAVDVQPGLTPQILTLQPLACMPVVVRDASGKPVADVTFESHGSSWTSGGSIETELLRQLGWSISSWTLGRTRSGADGRADLYFLDVPGLEIRFQAGGRKRSAKELRLTPTEEPVEITLR